VVLAVCGGAALVGVGVTLGGGAGDQSTGTTSSLVIATVASPVSPPPPTVPAPTVPSPVSPPPPTVPAPTVPSIDTPGSLWWLVNPDRPIPADYVPPELVTPDVPLEPDTGATQLTADTAAAFEAMVADARVAGYELQLTSGYRSYEQQQQLYDRFVEDFGADVAAERVALPGTSEHQTGLAADVGLVGLPDDQLFGDTAASGWVSENAHRFGLIIRYPPDKAHITGYTNEPWHLRYVGVELAAELQASGLTMEEHFGVVPASTPA
jgi:D-alanyl-D-alanine carboxypeptidase